MWIRNIKRQYQKLLKGIKFLKRHVEKSEAQTEVFGLSINAIFVDDLIVKSNLISSESVATSAIKDATVNTARRLCLLMSNLLGGAVSLALLKLVEEASDIKSGNVKYSHVMGFDVYGVEKIKGWKLTTLKGGVSSRNSDIQLRMGELSV